jgi:hypothetical protein
MTRASMTVTINNDERILIVGRDSLIFRLRRLLLGGYFHVDAANRLSEAKLLIAQQKFDLVILCSTLTGEECDQIIAVLHKAECFPNFLFLGRSERHQPEARCFTLSAEVGVFHLLKGSAELLGFEFKKNGVVRLPLAGRRDNLPNSP